MPSGDEEREKKPYSAKLINLFGIKTGGTVDYILEWVDVLAVAALLAWLIMSFVTVRMSVPTGSMKPTIQPNDSFFVDKISYHFRKPKRGDIVVFWHYRDDGAKTRYVKRLVAKGGDTVEIKDGDLYVNDEELTGEEFDRHYWAEGEYGTDEVEVPEGHYYALGDNSSNSFDSRFWGFFESSNLIGEPYLRVWPPGRFGLMN
ncbi:MAG: signal peptidase I, partial [Candidatus Acetothermia bacterium]